MAEKKRRNSSFRFDVGFELEGPPEITPAVQDATNEMLRLEERIPKAALDTLKNAGNDLVRLQSKVVAPIDGGLQVATDAAKTLTDRIDTAAVGLLGNAGETIDVIAGRAPVPTIAVAEEVAPAAPVDFGVAVQPPGAQPVFPPGGGVPPQLRDVFPPVAPPPPIGIQPGVGIVQPIHGGNAWTVYACCDTGKIEVYPPNQGPVGRVGQGWPRPDTGPCYLITVLPSKQAVDDYLAAIERDPNFRNGGLVKTVCCGKGDWKLDRCFGDKRPPQPTPPPKKGAPPPYTPPCPPPPKPEPPPGTCPVPEVKWCVSRNEIECRAIAHSEDKPPSGMGWILVACGLKEYDAYNRAAAEDKDAKDKCKPENTKPPEPIPPVLADPMCDPIAYCQYYAGAPLEGGGGPTSSSPGLAGIFGEDLEQLERESGRIGWIVSGFVGGVFAVIGRILKIADKYAGTSIWPRCEKQGALIRAHLQLSAVDWLTILFGGSFRRIGKPSQYIAQASCPMLFPGVADATNAYLAGTIEKDIWECWVAMHDYCVQPMQKVMEANATRYTVAEGLELYRQKFIKEDELREVYRYNGVIDAKLVDGMVLAQRQRFSPTELVRLVNRDLMSDAEARDEMRRHGFGYGKDIDQSFDLATPVFDLNTNVQLWLRGKLTDEEFEKAVFALGYVRRNAVDHIKELSNVLPPYSDLVRLMVRDAADTEIVRKFNLDVDFPEKFKGELAEWAKMQGVSETVMRYLWRAHWTIPSPTQLAEFWRRFRHPGHPSGLMVGIDAIKDALSQQDILPFWQDYYLASQFTPLTRVDTRRAFELGAIPIDEVRRSFRERGYSDPDAEILVNYTQRDYYEKLRKSPLVNAVAKLKITPAELRAELGRKGVAPAIIDSLIEYALDLCRADTRYKCTQNLAKRFNVGDFTPDQAVRELINQGHDPRFAQETVDGWVCKLATKSKEMTAAGLCKWFEIGIINAIEFVRRLTILGWNRSDAVRIVGECQYRLQQKAAKIAQQQAEKALKEMEKAAKEAGKEADKIEKDRQRAEKLRQAAKEAQDRRDKVLVKYAKVYADRNQLDITDTFGKLRDERSRVKSTYGLNDEAANQAVVLAVEGAPPAADEPIEFRIDEVAQSLANKVSPDEGIKPR